MRSLIFLVLLLSLIFLVLLLSLFFLVLSLLYVCGSPEFHFIQEVTIVLDLVFLLIVQICLDYNAFAQECQIIICHHLIVILGR